MSIIGLEACMLNPAHIEDTFSDCLATCSTHLGKSNNLRGSEVHPVLYSFSANCARVDPKWYIAYISIMDIMVKFLPSITCVYEMPQLCIMNLVNIK